MVDSIGTRYLQYECQLVKVRKDRKQANTVNDRSQTEEVAPNDDENENYLHTEIIYKSNLQQLKTLIEETAK